MLKQLVCFFLLLSLLCPTPLLGFVVAGKVLDQKQNPVAAASVTALKTISTELENTSAVKTEASGGFQLDLSESGLTPAQPFFLKITKPGYQRQTIFIDPQAKLALTQLSFTLRKLPSLEVFRVREASPQAQAERQGLSSTTLDQTAIEKMQLDGTEELSALAPNLHSLSTGSAFTHFFAIRGISSVNTVEPLIGMYIDGVSQFQTYTFPVYINNLKSIQILKGPQGTFYGRNAMGGVIDIQTYAPPNRFSAKGSAEWAQFGRQSYALDVSFPLFDNRFFLKTGGNYHQFDGFFVNRTLGMPSGGEQAYGGYLAFELFFNRFFNLSLRTKYEGLKEAAFPYSPTAEAAFETPFVLTQNKENYNTKQVVDQLVKITSETAYLKLSSITTYQLFQNTLGVDTDFSKQDLGEVDLKISQHLVTEEFKITSTELSGEWFTWLMGSYFYFQNRKAETELKTGSALIPNTVFIKTAEARYGLALFGSLTYPLRDNLHLILGLRGEYEHKGIAIDKTVEYKRSSAYPLGQTEVIPEKSLKRNNFNYAPKIGVNLYFSPTTLFYTSVARGYRSGGINGFVSDLAKVEYQPEDSWHSELGIKGAIKRFSFNTSFFYIYWQKQQVNVFFSEAGLFEFGIQNSGNSQSWGGEWEVRSPLLWGFAFETVLGFNEATFLSFKNASGEELRHNYQPFVPKHTLLLALEHEYKLQLFKLPFSQVNRIDYKYISEIFYNAENTATQPAYSLINLTTNLTYSKFTLSLWMKNVLDNRYLSFALPFSTLIPSKLGDPRHFGAKLSFLF